MSAASAVTQAVPVTPTFDWIRGVNLNGWLVLKRFVTPFLFAVTSCDLNGNFCYYSGQIGQTMNATTPICDYAVCIPRLLPTKIPDFQHPGTFRTINDFPADEFTLLKQFNDRAVAARYVEDHYNSFVQQSDIATLHAAGVSHLKVPFGHWLVGDMVDFINTYNGSTPITRQDLLLGPWVPHRGWPYLNRLVQWIRVTTGGAMKVWLEFDSLPGWDRQGTNCTTWSKDIPNVDLSLLVVERTMRRIVGDGLNDIITGMVVLPSSVSLTTVYGTTNNVVDCDITVVSDYYNKTLQLARFILGDTFDVIVGPAGLDPSVWNDRHLWQNTTYDHTYMAADYNQVDSLDLRTMTPKEHIAYACEEAIHNLEQCCWADDYYNATSTEQATPATGISRIVTAFSGGYDSDVKSMTYRVSQSILNSRGNDPPVMTRQLDPETIAFLANFIKAQMVAYEFAEAGISQGWFFETLKTEGGAFAEWDFLRGLQEGWIPNPLPPLTQPSDAVFGTCKQLMDQTVDNMAIVKPFPDVAVPNEPNIALDDDVVNSQGNSVPQNNPVTPYVEQKTIPTPTNPGQPASVRKRRGFNWFPWVAFIFFVYAVKRVFFNGGGLRRQYEPVRSIGLTV